MEECPRCLELALAWTLWQIAIDTFVWEAVQQIHESRQWDHYDVRTRSVPRHACTRKLDTWLQSNLPPWLWETTRWLDQLYAPYAQRSYLLLPTWSKHMHSQRRTKTWRCSWVFETSHQKNRHERPRRQETRCPSHLHRVRSMHGHSSMRNRNHSSSWPFWLAPQQLGLFNVQVLQRHHNYSW